jgi:hypothetical protein
LLKSLLQSEYTESVRFVWRDPSTAGDTYVFVDGSALDLTILGWGASTWKSWQDHPMFTPAHGDEQPEYQSRREDVEKAFAQRRGARF